MVFSKVDKQSQMASREPNVCQEHGKGNRRQEFHRLDLYDDFALYDDVRPESTRHPDPFVDNWDGPLRLYAQSQCLQFISESRLVHGLQ